MEVVETSKHQQVETLKVLIADDDPPTRILLRAAISQWGYEVLEAKDGEEAWEILQQENAPRLLILDWLMPKLDGIALCARIKQEMKYHPYIILLTQVTGTTNIVKGLEAGADEFLSKPFNMAELRSRLAVGAKIIRFENMLAQRNQSLEKISQLVKESFAKLEEINKNNAYIEASQKDSALLKNNQELQANLASLVNLLQEIDPEQTKRG